MSWRNRKINSEEKEKYNKEKEERKKEKNQLKKSQYNSKIIFRSVSQSQQRKELNISSENIIQFYFFFY